MDAGTREVDRIDIVDSMRGIYTGLWMEVAAEKTEDGSRYSFDVKA